MPPLRRVTRLIQRWSERDSVQLCNDVQYTEMIMIASTRLQPIVQCLDWIFHLCSIPSMGNRPLCNFDVPYLCQ